MSLASRQQEHVTALLRATADRPAAPGVAAATKGAQTRVKRAGGAARSSRARVLA